MAVPRLHPYRHKPKVRSLQRKVCLRCHPQTLTLIMRLSGSRRHKLCPTADLSPSTHSPLASPLGLTRSHLVAGALLVELFPLSPWPIGYGERPTCPMPAMVCCQTNRSPAGPGCRVLWPHTPPPGQDFHLLRYGPLRSPVFFVGMESKPWITSFEFTHDSSP